VTIRLSAEQARRFLVRRHLLAPPRSLAAEPESVLAVVERLGLLQFDPLEVPGARSHDIVLHSRINRYRREAREHETLSVRLEEIRDLPAETCDGVRITLQANIEFPHEVDACLAHGADGIGLYRTEFLYLGVTSEPCEEEQFEAYAQVVRSMQGRPVVIRTLDLGADKLGQLPRSEEEQNPCLGLRSIRLSLHNVATFRTQLRAVLRASTLGDVRLMFPLITTLPELRQARQALVDVMEDLKRQHVPFNPHIPIGMMVEVPAAVMMLDRFISEVDFISIGTNDLTQYTLAVDRGNRDVADLYRVSDPAVLRLIQRCVDVARQSDVPCSVCGEMGGTPAYVLVLLGLGLRSVSVVPSSVPQIKKICRSVTIARCEQLAQRVLAMDNAADIDAYLQKELKEVAPELAPH
jgi:phosphoenolpyruvate-protein phosphotransferase (PTS system enzyme I)